MGVQRLGVDVDGVAADFNTSFIDRTIAVTGKDLFPPRPFDIPTWNYPQHYGYSEAEVSAVWEHIKVDRFFWANLPPYSWTQKFLERLGYLSKQIDVYFITSRLGYREKEQTEQWLRLWTRGFVEPTVLISSAKGLCAKALKLDAYIDDRDANVRDVLVTSPSTRVFLLDQPWNQDVRESGITRVKDPNDMLNALAG